MCDLPPLTITELYEYSTNNPSTLIVIDFKAVWCKPCKEIKPFFTYLNENYPNVKFYEIDIEDDTRNTIVTNFNVIKLPTFIFYKNGIICSSLIGTNKEKLEETINEYL